MAELGGLVLTLPGFEPWNFVLDPDPGHPLIRDSGVPAIANPLTNIKLQGRHDAYPKRRGMTRVPELMVADGLE
jgi:hypothetical protein